MALVNSRTGQKALYSLPIGLGFNHIHVWKSLLNSAGLELSDIPRTWAAFWSFLCDECSQRCVGRRAATTSGLSA